MASGNLELYAAGSVVFTAGVPGYVWQSGEFTGVITDTGDGDLDLLMNAADGVDAAESAWIATPRVVLAASGNTTIGVFHDTDLQKHVTILQEAAVGGASILADVDFDFQVVKLRLV